MTEELLKVDNLKVSFQTYFGEVEAVRGVSFDLAPGKTLAIVGESGCGKSVTVRSIMKLQPSPPTIYKDGSIVYKGEEILSKSEKEMEEIRGSQISMIFQDPMTSLNPTMKVGAQIVEGVKKNKKMSKKEQRDFAINMLKEVSVPEPEKRVDQYPHEFSGGMRQRVMIAIAMSSNPALLLADEPTTALDVTVQAQIMDIMKKLQEEYKTAIILITHDLGVVADIADDILVMYAGQIVESGDVNDIYYNPTHPYTEKLLEAVPRIDKEKDQKLSSIAGSPPDLYKPPKGCAFYERCHKAMKICKDNMPDLVEENPGHFCRCFLSYPAYKEYKNGKSN